MRSGEKAEGHKRSLRFVYLFDEFGKRSLAGCLSPSDRWYLLALQAPPALLLDLSLHLRVQFITADAIPLT